MFRLTCRKRAVDCDVSPRPHRKLAEVQHWVLTNILNLLPVHPCAHGFVAQHSVLTNAEPHVGASVVINADLSNFFPTITFPRVDGMFRKLGYSPAVATILALSVYRMSATDVEIW